MSLLEDLESLDLSAITGARAQISVSFGADDLTAVIDGEAVRTALGGLGERLGELGSLDGPQALVGPLLDALSELGGSLDVGDFPLADYAQAVRAGAEIFSELLGGEPVLERLVSGPLSAIGEGADQAMAAFMRVGGSEIERFSSVVAMFDGGELPDPAQLGRLAVDALVPAGAGPLSALRAAVDATVSASASIGLPASRTTGLVIAFDAVAAAALRGDAAAVTRALAALEAARATTLGSLRTDLLGCLHAVDRLPLGAIADALGQSRAALRAGSEGILELLELWRGELGEARAIVEGFDPQAMLDVVPGLLTQIEELALAQIAAPIEQQVARLEQWLRALLAELPLAELRGEVARIIQDIARRIDDADLGRYADEARAAISSVADALGPDLVASVQAALAGVAATLDAALSGVEDALAAIAAAIDGVADQALAVLEPAVQALASFRTALEGLTHATGSLGIEQAGDEVVRRLAELRETVEDVLSVAPLPEPLRPLVEQLVGVLEGLDVEAQIGAPIRAAAAELRVPDEIGETMSRALEAAGEALANVIPAQLVASIEQEIEEGLSTIASFDPATLLPDMSGFVAQAATTIRGLDPRPLAADVGAPFEQLLAGFDALHPRLLMAPVITAYDDLIGAIPAPPAPAETAQRAAALMDVAGEAVGQAMAQPLLRAGGDALEVAPAGGGPAAGAPPASPTTPVRPGDVVRLLGYVPTKLRDALRALAAGPAGQVVAAIDALTGGLAADLRALQGVLHDVDARLRAQLDALLVPVTVAQLRAGVALQASFGDGARAGVGGGGATASIDLQGSLDVLARTGPGALRAELAPLEDRARERARVHASGLGSTSLAAAADALERSRLGAIGGDLDRLLATLDVEPLAAEVDALAAAAFAKAPQVAEAIGEQLEAAVQRLRQLMRDLNPAAQAQRFLRLLAVLHEQLDLLDPGRLADELGEIHAAIRSTLQSYDPVAFVAELGAAVEDVAATVEALDPAQLLGDLDVLGGIGARVAALDPAAALDGIGAQLTEVGEQLAQLDPSAMLAAVNELAPLIAEQLTRVIASVRNEIVALLESLRFASGSVSVSVSAEVDA